MSMEAAAALTDAALCMYRITVSVQHIARKLYETITFTHLLHADPLTCCFCMKITIRTKEHKGEILYVSVKLF